MRTRLQWPCLLAFVLSLTGCGGGGDETPGQQVDVSGTVSVAGAKIPAGVSISFQPTAGKGLPAVFPLKPDGTFSGKMNTATYSYFLTFPETNQKLEAAMKALPESARKASLDRQIDIKGGNVEIKFE